jgi:hypothetical protein
MPGNGDGMVDLTVERLLAIVDVARIIRDRADFPPHSAFPSLVAEALELLTGSIKIW